MRLSLNKQKKKVVFSKKLKFMQAGSHVRVVIFQPASKNIKNMPDYNSCARQET